MSEEDFDYTEDDYDLYNIVYSYNYQDTAGTMTVRAPSEYVARDLAEWRLDNHFPYKIHSIEKKTC